MYSNIVFFHKKIGNKHISYVKRISLTMYNMKTENSEYEET